MKKRLAHIDMAKAIGLIIIMTSHINSYPSLGESVSMRWYQDVIPRCDTFVLCAFVLHSFRSFCTAYTKLVNMQREHKGIF